MIERLRRLLSRIWLRLLAFNVLLVFLPAAGVLFLDTYEQHLLAAQERTMVQEGRLLAAAIEASGRLDGADAQTILIKLSQRHEARLRVVDSAGRLLADSSHLGPRREAGDAEGASPTAPARSGWLYRLGSLPFRIGRRLSEDPVQVFPDAYDSSRRLQGPEIDNALAGRYGAATRLSPGNQASLTLYCAIPIRDKGSKVVGAVLVSQSTLRILRTLDAVRLGVFQVFLASLAAAVVLSLVLATTIARPLARLRRQSEAILDRRGRLRGSFAPSQRRDEIGELERALAELTRRLESHIQLMEAFASDVAHEFKNPLASIRTATDLALDADTPAQREHFLAMIQRDVMRMGRLLSDAREISRIDASIDLEERQPVDLSELLPTIVEGFRLRLEPGPQIVLVIAEHDVLVSASADRLTQVLENLLENATSFAPEHSTVTVTVRARPGAAVVSVADEGPGVPEEHLDRIFSRFFSYRPGDSAGDDHSGIGLAIVRAIVEGYGGTVEAANRPAAGAELKVTLPRVRPAEA